MSFGSGSGFSFGGNNNNNQSTGFGGFGNNNTNTGFGTSTTNTGFGSSTTGTNPFGGGTSTFGSNTGGFGANNTNTGSSLFGGSKTAATNPFGSTTNTTSLFGGSANNNTPTTGGFGSGGFGSSATNTGGFGSTNTGNNFTFGNNANKPAFGSSTTTPLFGQNGAGTTGGFGSTGAFGSAGTGTALNQPVGPSEGTASTPFSATSEKEGTGVTNSYQSITFQQPYQKYSFEELRLADYNAGRQFGNGSGQPGAFGSNAFGGFGSNNTGGFGSSATNTNPFGATTSPTTFGNNNTTSGFGGGTGLFGNTANKPGGLFGNTNTSASTTGGLFGTASNTNTGFGSTNTGFGSNASGGLFGNTNQNKPTTGLFGSATNTTNNVFGSTNTAANTSGGLFGNNNTTNTSGAGLFGNANQQNTSGGLFGNASAGSSLFGNKPGTGFGTQTTQPQTGGLFGTAATNTGTSGGLFGNNANSANTNTSGGLFGNNANTGGGLFGATNNNAQSGQKSLFGGGFGTANTAANTGGLFSNNNNTANQPSGGLFGNNNASGGFSFNQNANKPTTSLFGNASTNQQSTGLFGSTNNNTSLFGQSQNNQQSTQQQQDGVKHASLLDPNPYGQSSIWTGLPQPTPENAKPVFTPLTATQKMKESMMKPPPSLRLNQSRYMTPPRRNGFGFTYSTYGTPNSAASTPGGGGLSGSMYGSRGFSGGSFGRSFNKSASVQNLRSQFASDSDDIWKPGAFTSTHRNSSGSIKRLTIDRTIRNDLFSRPSVPALLPPEQTTTTTTNGPSGGPQTNGEIHHDTSNKLKKRVSFENGISGGLQNSQLNGENGALVRTETDDEERFEETNGRANGASADTQPRSKDLAMVPEDRESHHTSTRPVGDVQAKSDPKPGDYWMKPTRAEQTKLPREQLQKFKDFQVGRHGCGQVTFNGSVDLTALPLDDLYDKIVEIRLRSVTVYPDASSKPPVGKGLNVPSTISIENSWPRSRNQPSSATSGPVFDKHIQRLKKMAGTEFVDYETATGIWTFRVPHYTRYGLDYDDDEDMTELTAPPDTIEKSVMEVDSENSNDEHEHDDDDDTFAFKQKMVPGGFGRQSAIDYGMTTSAPVDDAEDDHASEQSLYSDEEMSEDEPSMVGSFPVPSAPNLQSPNRPILKPTYTGTPGRPLLDLEGDWAEQLQRTISPRKQNRDMLRETQSKVLLDRVYSPIKPKAVEKKDFRTSIDVMNSLFGLSDGKGNSGRKQAQAEPEFEFPYAKRAKTFDSSLQDMSEPDKKWHDSFKTQFTGIGELIYKRKNMEKQLQNQDYAEEELVSGQGDVVVKSALRSGAQAFHLKSILALNKIATEDNVPIAHQQSRPFSDLAEHVIQPSTMKIETDLYNLLHVLFDDYDDEFTHHLPTEIRDQYENQIRRDRLTKFLSSYVVRKHGERLAKVESENPTAAAVIRLTANDISGACNALDKAKNYKLMVLVSQLEHAGEVFQDDIRAQIDAWREQRVLSEMTEDVRTIYELCAGNTTISAGKSGNNVPVEDKAKTFSIADEYGLDWVQSFALGLWFGREEKKYASAAGVVNIETAVLEFGKRCQRKEESQLPGNDPLWMVLKLYAATRGVKDIEAPVFPTALDALSSTWDVGKTFNLHYSIIANIEGVMIDEDAEEELAGLLAYQLSSKGDIAGAAYAILHLHEADKRELMFKNLLERFAGQLTSPPFVSTSESATTGENTAQAKELSTDLWTVLTQKLKIPEAWLYQAKALHARAVHADSTIEFEYLVAAKAWDEAHDCFTHRVAPGLVVDNDTEALHKIVNLFDDNVMEDIAGWEMGGGIYADFALMCMAKGQLNQIAVEGLRKRLVELGRKFKKGVDLGKLPIEELEERVAVQEMSRIVAEKFEGSRKDILELPLTSDQILTQTVAMAGEYYRAVVAGTEVA